jgi:uncharacterized protein (TIGR02588 family)
MSEERGRTTPEWVTFAVSSALLLVVVVLLAVQVPGDDSPPAPVATVAQVREVDGRFHVDVVLENTGDATAMNAQVTAELDVGGRRTTGDQTVDFLAGGEEEDLVFVFDDDPAGGALTVAVTGYARP